MKEDKLGDLSMELSVEVLKLTKELRTKHETVINALILSIIDFPNQHQMIIENAEDDIQCFRNTYDGVIEKNVFMKLISQSQNNIEY